jgi:hypothetical protein
MFRKKLQCLLYLGGIEQEVGKVSAKDVMFFFSGPDKWGLNYYHKLIYDGWITDLKEVRKNGKPFYRGTLSPLTNELFALLRRRMEIAADLSDPSIPRMPRVTSKEYPAWLEGEKKRLEAKGMTLREVYPLAAIYEERPQDIPPKPKHWKPVPKASPSPPEDNTDTQAIDAPRAKKRQSMAVISNPETNSQKETDSIFNDLADER